MLDGTLSVVVIFHNMIREAPRTLFTLSRAYQRNIEKLNYEVIAIGRAGGFFILGRSVGRRCL